MLVVICEVEFHLLVSKFMPFAEFFCLVEDVARRHFFAVFFDAVLRDEEERLLFHRLALQKFEDAADLVRFEVLADLGEPPQQFAVEFPVFFGAEGFRFAYGGVHGEIFHEERLAGEQVHEVALLPKAVDLEQPFVRDLQKLCQRFGVRFRLAGAKVQTVQIHPHGVAVRLRQILRDELVFHAREHIRAEIFGKGGEGHLFPL